MDVEELVPPDDFEPNLKTAIDAIESRSTDYTLTVPARPGVNPFTGEVQMSQERKFDSVADMLLLVCMIPAEDLTSRSNELVRETILGHVWNWDPTVGLA